MLSEKEMPEVNAENCTGCGECVQVCPSDALSIQEEKVVISADAECSYCGECEEVCPTGAITCPYDIVFVDDYR